MTMSAVDFLDQWFETDALKATMSASGSSARSWACARRAPRTCCCTTTWARSTARSARGASRGAALARSPTRSRPRRVKPASRSARTHRSRRCSSSMAAPTGVVLDNGDEIARDDRGVERRSAAHLPRVGRREHLPTNSRRSRALRFRGPSGKVNLALDGLPDFTCLPGPGAHLRGAISISPSVDYMERAYDDAKYGRFSRRPYMDVVIPTLTDPRSPRRAST